MLVGFFVSIFFPTLYSLAIEGLGEQTAKASGLLTMGFLGCALLPVLQGRLADTIGLQRSFGICIVPYLFALFYALRSCKSGPVPNPAHGRRKCGKNRGPGWTHLRHCKTMKHLVLSKNHRFLVWEDGVPFFWLGDTVWELFHRTRH